MFSLLETDLCDILYAAYEEYFVWAKDKQTKLLKNEENIPWSLYIGVAGMPGNLHRHLPLHRSLTKISGMTAYVGWKKYARFNKGDTVFVTTAAGPVGA